MEYVFINEDELKKYLKENPLLKDENYSEDDLISDLTKASGTYTLPGGTKEDTAEFISRASERIDVLYLSQ